MGKPRKPRQNAPAQNLVSCHKRGERGDLQEKLDAEYSFVHEGATLAEIGRALGRSYNTIKAWCEEGGWEAKRMGFLTSSDGSADILERQLRNILLELETGKRDLTAALADMVLKVNRTIQDLRGDKHTMTLTFAVLNLFLAHLRAAQPDLLPQLERHVESFLEARKRVIMGQARGG